MFTLLRYCPIPEDYFDPLLSMSKLRMLFTNIPFLFWRLTFHNFILDQKVQNLNVILSFCTLISFSCPPHSSTICCSFVFHDIIKNFFIIFDVILPIIYFRFLAFFFSSQAPIFHQRSTATYLACTTGGSLCCNWDVRHTTQSYCGKSHIHIYAHAYVSVLRMCTCIYVYGHVTYTFRHCENHFETVYLF